MLETTLRSARPSSRLPRAPRRLWPGAFVTTATALSLASGCGMLGGEKEKETDVVALPAPVDTTAAELPEAHANPPGVVDPPATPPVIHTNPPSVPALPVPTPTAAPTTAPTTAPTASASAQPSAAPAVNYQACFEKCSGVIQACLSPKFPPDGGAPTVNDPATCTAAGDTCKASCK